MANKIQQFLQKLVGKSSQRIKLITDDYYRLIGFNELNGTNQQEQIDEGFASNPYFFMVIDSIASIAARLPKRLVNTERPEQDVNADDLTELLMQPNDDLNGEQFMYSCLATYLAQGECFIVGKRPIGFSQYAQLITPRPTNTSINETRQGDILNYSYTYFGENFNAEKEDVLHIKKPDLTCDTHRGFSTLTPGSYVFQSNNEVWKSEYSLHKNKGISGVLYSDGNRVMTPSEQKNLQNYYDQQFTGFDKFGKVKVSNQRLGFLQMGINPNDLKSIETRIEHLRTACALYGVASQLYGDTSASTYNNMMEAKLARYTDVILPLLDMFLTTLSEWLIQQNYNLPNVVLEVDKDQISELKRPRFELSTRLISEVQAGIISAEEAKDILYPNGL